MDTIVECKREDVPKKKRILKRILIVICCVVLFFVLLFGGVIGYFRLPVQKYYRASEKAFVIPGTNDGFIAQGISFDERTQNFFVTGYMKDKSCSPVYLVPKEGKKNEYKTLYLQNADGGAYTGHCGGLTVYGDYIYVAGGAENALYVYSYEQAIALNDREELPCLGAFLLENGGDALGAAYVSVWDDCLVVGEFYREGNYPTAESHKRVTSSGEKNEALALCYPFSSDGESESTFGLANEPTAAISMRGLVQGACFEDGKAVLSCSYGTAFSRLYEYDLKKAETGESIEAMGKTLPLYSFDNASLLREMKLPPMSEEIVTVDGKAYVMCESASNKYIFGKFTGGKWCYATDLSRL